MKIVSLEQAQGGTTWVVHGPPGAGKTTLAGSLGEVGKTLFLDLAGERGTSVLIGTPYASNLEIAQVDVLADVEEALQVLEEDDGRWAGVVLDSVTALQSIAVQAVMNQGRTTPRETSVTGIGSMSQQMWGISGNVVLFAIQRLFALASATRKHPMHVVIVAQTKRVMDEVSGESILVPDVQNMVQGPLLRLADYSVTATSKVDARGKETHAVTWANSTAAGTKRRLPVGKRGFPTSLPVTRPDGTEVPATMHTLISLATAPLSTEKKD